MTIENNPQALKEILKNLRIRVRAQKGIREADIDARIETLRDVHAKSSIVKDKNKIEKGDEVTLDVIAYAEGKAVFSQSNAAIKAGAESGMYAPLAKALVGKSANAATVVPLTLQGQALVFALRIKRVVRLTRASAVEALAAAHYGEDARAKIRQELLHSAASDLIRDAQTRALKSLMKKTNFRANDKDIDARLLNDFQAQNHGHQNAHTRQAQRAYVAQATHRNDAALSIFREAFLDAIAQAFGLDAQVQSTLEALAKSQSLERSLVNSIFRRKAQMISALQKEARRNAALEFVMSNISVSFVAPRSAASTLSSSHAQKVAA